MLKTISYDQQDIMSDIMKLHCPEGFQLDPTYSKGVFYKNDRIPQPLHKYDLYPTSDEVQKANANCLPLETETIKSIIFDPPFLAGQTKKDAITGIIPTRFHGFPYVEDLWTWYSESLEEMHRVLENKGKLVFKCQDTVNSGKQYFSHVYIINEAERIGFYMKDLFVLLAKSRIVGKNHKKQYHARKYHSYFLVFEKKGKTIDHVSQRIDLL